MAIERKAQPDAIARIETRGCPRVVPPYGGSVDRLPASFWAGFRESLEGHAVDDRLDAGEWSLMQAAREVGYHFGHDVISSIDWSDFIMPLDSEGATANDVLHAAFASLTGMGLDDCEIVDLVPYERLVLRAYGYWGLLIPGPDRNRRRATLVVRGMCSAVMDLAYGGTYDRLQRSAAGRYTCSQTRSVEAGDPYDEFVTTRA